jgi:hypothetical protein
MSKREREREREFTVILTGSLCAPVLAVLRLKH